MEQTRRDFLLATTLAPAGLAAAPKLRFPTAARDRLAIASYSFRSLIDTPRNREKASGAQLIALKDFPAAMAQKYDIHNVELLGQHFRSTEPAYLAELRDAVKAAGSRVVNIPTSVGASFYDPAPGQRRLAVNNAKAWVDRAAAVGCPSIRVAIQRITGTDPDLDTVSEALSEVADYGEKKSVVVNLENDNLISEDAFFIVRVLDQVRSQWLRALPDFCNSMLKGDETFNYDAVRALFRRAYNICHAKDSEVSNGRTYRIDLPRTFQIARTNGFEGYFSIEWEGEGDVWVETGKLIDQSLRTLSL